MSNILLLTGRSGSGKTRTLREILMQWDDSDLHAGGILAPGRYLDSGEKEFDLELLPGDVRYFLSARKRQSEWTAMGNFWFNPKAVEAGLSHLHALSLHNYDLYVLDEIGPFELDGLLWAPAIPDLLNKGIPMIWTLRHSILDEVCSKWRLKNPKVVQLSEDKTSNSISTIRSWISEFFSDQPQNF